MEQQDAITTRQKYINRHAQLDAEYTTWRTTQEQICTYMQPGRGRFNETDTVKGQRQDQQIVNDTAVMAQVKLEGAMDTGITSAARKWARLAAGTSQAYDAGQAIARDYLDEVERIFFETLSRSNYYQTHRNIYRDVIGPATGLMFIEEDDVEDVRFIHVPVGQYRLAVDARGRVNEVHRGPFAMTVAQVVGEFGIDACSDSVKQSWQADKKSDTVLVLHVVEERTEREYGKIDAKNKPWASCWMEYGGGSNTGGSKQDSANLGLLRESGYDEKPFVAPRWSVVGLDPYGRDSPGWQSIGDSKALQALVRSNAQTLALIGKPPMNQPPGMSGGQLVPGKINPVPDGKQKFEASVIIPPAAVTVGNDLEARHEARINRAHFSDILYRISLDQRNARATAAEVNAGEREQLLLLGGVFGRLADEDLKPTVIRVLAILQRKGKVAAPPQELGAGVAIVFENILVATQKTLQITSVERVLATTTMVENATGRADAAENLDDDAIVAMVVDMLGAPSKMLLDPKKRDARRQQRQQAAQAKAQGEAMATAAKAIPQVAETDTEKLNQLVQTYGPAAQAQAG